MKLMMGRAERASCSSELKKEESSWSRQKGALATCHKVAMSPASAIMPPDIFGHLTGSRFILVILID